MTWKKKGCVLFVSFNEESANGSIWGYIVVLCTDIDNVIAKIHRSALLYSTFILINYKMCKCASSFEASSASILSNALVICGHFWTISVYQRSKENQILFFLLMPPGVGFNVWNEFTLLIGFCVLRIAHEEFPGCQAGQSSRRAGAFKNAALFSSLFSFLSPAWSCNSLELLLCCVWRQMMTDTSVSQIQHMQIIATSLKIILVCLFLF